jgi:MFS family permease
VLDLWRISTLRTVFIVGAVINAAQNLFQFYFPIYGHSLGLSASAIGVILGVVAGANFAIRSVMPFLLGKRSEGQILTYAVFITAFAYALLPWVGNPYALGAIAFLMGIGTGCANPLSMSLLYLLTPQGRVAEALGLLKTIYNFSHVVIPLLFSSVGAAFGFAPVFLSNATMLFAAGALIRMLRLPIGPPGDK